MSKQHGRKVVHRTAARVLLIGPGDRLLLVHGHDPYDASAGSWWFPVGGGIESGEPLHEAAIREVREETGISDITLGPLVWHRTAGFPYLEDQYLYQKEHFFLGWTATSDLRPEGWTEYERRQLTDMRWWSLDELQSTTERLVPGRLATLWPDLLRGRYPEGPVDVGP